MNSSVVQTLLRPVLETRNIYARDDDVDDDENSDDVGDDDYTCITGTTEVTIKHSNCTGEKMETEPTLATATENALAYIQRLDEAGLNVPHLLDHVVTIHGDDEERRSAADYEIQRMLLQQDELRTDFQTFQRDLVVRFSSETLGSMVGCWDILKGLQMIQSSTNAPAEHAASEEAGRMAADAASLSDVGSLGSPSSLDYSKSMDGPTDTDESSGIPGDHLLPGAGVLPPPGPIPSWSPVDAEHPQAAPLDGDEREGIEDSLSGDPLAVAPSNDETSQPSVASGAVDDNLLLPARHDDALWWVRLMDLCRPPHETMQPSVASEAADDGTEVVDLHLPQRNVAPWWARLMDFCRLPH